MPTTKDLFARFTLGTGLGLAVIAGGAVAAGAAPPDPTALLGDHPPIEYEFDHELDLTGDPIDEPMTLDPSYVDPSYVDLYPGLGIPEFVLPDGDPETAPEGGDGPTITIPDVPDDVPDYVPDVDPDLDPELDPGLWTAPGPIGDLEPCVPVAVCPPAEIPEETPDETPEDTPDETPDETPEDTPDESPDDEPDDQPVVPVNKGSLAFTGAGSILLAAIGTGVAGAGVAVHRLSRRMNR